MPPDRAGPIVRIAELEIDPNQNVLLSEEVEASVRIEPRVLRRSIRISYFRLRKDIAAGAIHPRYNRTEHKAP
jgi:hypothetical protein